MLDLIDRREAIDALCDNCDNVQAVCPHYPCKQYIAIDALPYVQSEPQWIPCSERLPEEEGEYMVTDDAGGMATVSVDEFIYADDGEPMWLYSQNVTAWRERPEPWRGEEQ